MNYDAFERSGTGFSSLLGEPISPHAPFFTISVFSVPFRFVALDLLVEGHRVAFLYGPRTSGKTGFCQNEILENYFVFFLQVKPIFLSFRDKFTSNACTVRINKLCRTTNKLLNRNCAREYGRKGFKNMLRTFSLMKKYQFRNTVRVPFVLEKHFRSSDIAC